MVNPAQLTRAPEAIGSPPERMSALQVLPLAGPAEQADESVVRADGLEEVAAAIGAAWRRGQGVWIVSEQLDWLAARLGLSARDAEGRPRIWFGPCERPAWDRLLSRGLQLLLTSGVLLVGAPLWLLIALLVRWCDRGPALHRSLRAGRGGSAFSFLKFRTMRACECGPGCRCDLGRARLRRGFIRGSLDEEQSAVASPNLGRITTVGDWLRRSGLDEVPQFLHVLTGRMAVVGPRPYLLDETIAFKDWHRLRLEGLPGITGLWQVNGYHEVGFDQSVILDLYYLANRTVGLDAEIVLKTPLRMLSGLKKTW